jgi:HD-GYP domain-containing protein (c-di-GMP phosphodiesterase class II)
VSCALAAAVALVVGAAALASGFWNSLEAQSLGARFGLRGTTHPKGIVIVAVDKYSQDNLKYPFPRSREGQVALQLHRLGAKAIAFDMEFATPTSPSQDGALINDIANAGGAIMSATASEHGQTTILGGTPQLSVINSVAARSNITEEDGKYQSYRYSIDGIQTFGLATAERVLGHRVTPAQFGPSPALIDYPGPARTFPVVSFEDVRTGHVDPSLIRGKIAVIGATDPTLDDIHDTPVGVMAGPEIQAAAIWTALHGNPLRPAAPWLGWLAVILFALLTPVLVATIRMRRAIWASVAAVVGYGVACVVAFDHGTVLIAVAPIATWAVSFTGTVAVCMLVGELSLHSLRGILTIRDRELEDTELEIIYRLARASESRDQDTGDHVDRIRHLCEKLALAHGMDAAEARQLGLAAVLHDIGKIGVPDSVLLKPGKLDDEEWVLMRAHTTIGADILAGSDRPLIQLGEEIARTHHEKWDGNGYPAKLKGEEIPLSGRICALCDVFDALLSPRPYKDAWTAERTLAEIEKCAGSHFDPDLARTFLTIAPELAKGYEGMTAEEVPAQERPVPSFAPARAQ